MYTREYYHAERVKETATVKAALQAQGFQVLSVRHGTGTAHGWLHIKVKGVWSRDLNARVVTIAQAATGRHGDYDGRIGVDATGGD